MTTTTDNDCSFEERMRFVTSPEAWDSLYAGGIGDPTVQLNFEGDTHTWSQVKLRSVELGVKPEELVRFALYQFIEGANNAAAARARFLAYREWYRTRPIWVRDRKGGRWESADQAFNYLLKSNV